MWRRDPVTRGLKPQAGHKAGRVIAGQCPNRGGFEVVVVGVADEHDINGRQIGIGDPRRMRTLWADTRQRTHRFGEHWIGEDIDPGDLDKRCRVTDPGGTQAVHALGGGNTRLAWRSRPGRERCSARNEPAPQIALSTRRLGAPRVEETPTVKVIGRRDRQVGAWRVT